MNRYYKRCQRLLKNKKMGWKRLHETGTVMIPDRVHKPIMRCSLTSGEGSAQMHHVPGVGSYHPHFDVFFRIQPEQVVRISTKGLQDRLGNKLSGGRLRAVEEQLNEILSLNGV